jgi:hypothetical protein
MMRTTADQREYICHLDKDQQVELYTLLAAADTEIKRFYVINDYRRKHPIKPYQIARLRTQRGISAQDMTEYSLPLDDGTEALSSTATTAQTSTPSTPSSND